MNIVEREPEHEGVQAKACVKRTASEARLSRLGVVTLLHPYEPRYLPKSSATIRSTFLGMLMACALVANLQVGNVTHKTPDISGVKVNDVKSPSQGEINEVVHSRKM